MQLMLVTISTLSLLVICLVAIIRRNTTNSPFVKYNGIVYHKTDVGEGMSILVAGSSAYVQWLPSDTKWEYATAKEKKQSEDKIKHDASRNTKMH